MTWHSSINNFSSNIGHSFLMAASCGFMHVKNGLLVFQKSCVLSRYSVKCLITHNSGSLSYTMNEKGSIRLVVFDCFITNIIGM